MRGVRGTLYPIAGFISEQIWGRLPGALHLAVSAVCARLYRTKISRHFIRPYCRWQYRDVDHHKKFVPGSGEVEYRSFQDFFTRNFATPPEIRSENVWPCEGYLCEKAKVEELSTVRVKGERRNLRTIFGATGEDIPGDGYFSNVFLHNKNYHHIHAPVSGIIARLERVPGELLLLRPWAYKERPSLPALTNERVNLTIEDASRRNWYLSIVGGPLVATINLPDWLQIGSQIVIGQKLASFEIGSTCCMVSPVFPEALVGESIDFGSPLTTEVAFQDVANKK